MYVIFSGFSGQNNLIVSAQSAGSRQIHNSVPEWGRECRVKLEFVRKYGEYDSTDEDLQLFRPKDLVMDSKGGIYILDTGNYLVKKFNSEGKFLFSFGEKGQGPGEFQMPMEIEIDRNDDLYISDFTNRVIHVFGKDGDYKTGIRPGDMMMPKQLLMLEGGKIAAFFLDLANSDRNFEQKAVKIVDVDSKSVIDEFGTKRVIENERFKNLGNEYNLSVDKEGNIYMAFSFQNRIEKFDKDLDLVWRMDRKKSYDVLSEKRRRTGQTSGNRRFTSQRVNRLSTGIQVDKYGRLWIGSQKRAFTEEELMESEADNENLSIIEIYNNKGILLGEFNHDSFSNGRLFRIVGDRFFIIDALETHSVYEYLIVEK